MAARTTVRTNLNGKQRPTVSHAKITSAPETDPDESDHPESSTADDVPAGPGPVDALADAMNSLQGASNSRITVYRIVKNQPQSYVFECDPASFSLDDLRDKYNGGEFRLYITKNSVLWRNMRVFVEPKQVGAVHDSAPPVTQVADMMAVMREGFAAQNAALREALAARPPVASPFSGMDIPQVITAIAAAITALRPPAPPPTPDTSEKALDMFMRGLEIANSMRDSAPSADNSLGGMLRDVLRSPILATAVQAAAQPTPPTRPAQPALPNPAQPVSHAKPAAEPQPQPQPESAQVLSYYLGILVGKAQGGADPSLYAELVLDNVPDNQLIPMLQRGDQLIEDFIKLHPPVAQHRDWFVKLIAEVNDLLEPEPEGAELVQPVGEAHAADTATTVVPGQPAQ